MRFRPWLLALSLVALVGCADKPAEPVTPPTKPAIPTTPANPVGTLKDLKIDDLEVGKGQEVAEGDTVAVIYAGKLENGTEFDSNTAKASPPYHFIVGVSSVIQGWHQGLVGMKVGGKRKLSIPSKLGYGAQGSPPRIGPNVDLYFEIQLLDVVKQKEAQIYDKKITKPGSGPAAKKGDEISIHYVGTLVNGLKFDSSRDRGEPYAFKLGMGQVVAGMDAALVGMKVGGVCELRIPPDLAYGPAGRQPAIPPNARLLFTIEVMSLKPGK